MGFGVDRKKSKNWRQNAALLALKIETNRIDWMTTKNLVKVKFGIATMKYWRRQR
jgi:hypothetical protein